MIERNERSQLLQPQGSNDPYRRPRIAHNENDFARVLRQQHLRQEAQQAQAQPTGTDIPTDVNGLTFSKHATQRLLQRRIDLEPDQSRRLENAVQSAAHRGARQSLVLMDGIAFIVNVQDRKVITALDAEPGQRTSGQAVFTNIDSAVVA